MIRTKLLRLSGLLATAYFGSIALVHAQSQQVGLQNPLNPEFSSIPNFVSGVLKVMVMIALPIISLFIVYSGFLFVAAQGNSEKIDQAKRNFLYVIIGATLILGAWVIANLIGGTVTQITGTSTTF